MHVAYCVNMCKYQFDSLFTQRFSCNHFHSILGCRDSGWSSEKKPSIVWVIKGVELPLVVGIIVAYGTFGRCHDMVKHRQLCWSWPKSWAAPTGSFKVPQSEENKELITVGKVDPGGVYVSQCYSML